MVEELQNDHLYSLSRKGLYRNTREGFGLGGDKKSGTGYHSGERQGVRFLEPQWELRSVEEEERVLCGLDNLF